MSSILPTEIDSVATDSTPPSEPRDEYEVEAILGERNFDGVTKYFVKWEHYDDIRATWEPAENFGSDVILSAWKKSRLQRLNKKKDAYDVVGLERRIEDWIQATQERKARRQAKRIRLGLPVAELNQDESSDAEFHASNELLGSDADSEEDRMSVDEPVGSKRRRLAQERPKRKGVASVKPLRRKMGISSHEDDGESNIFMDVDDDDDDDDDSSDEDRHKRGRLKVTTASSEGKRKAKPDKPGEIALPQIDTSSPLPLPRGNSLIITLKTARAQTSSKEPIKKNSAAKETLTLDTSKQRSTRPSQPTTGTKPIGKPIEMGRKRETGPIKPGPRKIPLSSNLRTGMKRTSAPSTVKRKNNIFANWDSDLSTRRPGRPPTLTTAVAGVDKGTFRNLSTQNKYYKYGKNEAAPSAESLTLFTPQTGKILEQKAPAPGSSKSPFQLIQEQAQSGDSEIHASPVQQVSRFTSNPTKDVSNSSALSNLPAITQNVQAKLNASINNQPSKVSTSNAIASEDDEGDALRSPIRKRSVRFAEEVTEFQLSQRSEDADTDIIFGAEDGPAALISQSPSSSSEPEKGSEPEVAASTSASHSWRSAFQRIPYEFKERSAPKISVVENTPSNPDEPIQVDWDDSTNMVDHGIGFDDDDDGQGMSESPALLPLLTEAYAVSGTHTTSETNNVPETSWFPDAVSLAKPPPHPDALMYDELVGNYEMKQWGRIYGTIFIGNRHVRLGDVAFAGFALRPKTVFLTIKRPPKEVFIDLNHVCTPEDFRAYIHSEHERMYLSAGHLFSFTHLEPVFLRLARSLEHDHLGALFFADNFTLLVYPRLAEGWDFIDTRFRKQHDPTHPSDPPDELDPGVVLRFVMISPRNDLITPLPHESTTSGEPTLITGEPAVNALFRTAYSIEYSALLPVMPAKRLDDKRMKGVDGTLFFLLYPQSKLEEHDLLVRYLAANNATICSSFDSGAWDYFVRSTRLGTILIHSSITSVHGIPNLVRCLTNSTAVFHTNLSIPREPFSAPLTRLFPHGAMILITPSLMLLEPHSVVRLLDWFANFTMPTKTPGTWKLALPPNFRSWIISLGTLRDIEAATPYVQMFITLGKLLPLELMDPDTDFEVPTEDAPVVTPGHLDIWAVPRNTTSTDDYSINEDTEQPGPILYDPPAKDKRLRAADNKLVDWFAEYAISKMYSTRRFKVIYAAASWDTDEVKEKWSDKWNHVAFVKADKAFAEHKIEEWEMQQKAKKIAEEKREMEKEKAKRKGVDRGTDLNTVTKTLNSLMGGTAIRTGSILALRQIE
ncbi:hypothetical protein MMC25_000812 [Agyrium rufum]|nr:hypothetical protein [Agyrium rufum]